METSITEMILGMGKKPGTLEVHLEWRPLLEEFSGVYGEIQDCICLERTRTADEELFAVSIAFLAPGLIDSPDEIKIHKHSESLFDFLDEYCGVSPVYFENEIEIVFPDANIAKKLHITPSDPIFKLRRYQYSAENKLLVVSSDFFNLKKLSFKVNRYRLVDPIGKKYIQEEKN
jgi:DNA-binding GntR family transcriptional regulator